MIKVGVLVLLVASFGANAGAAARPHHFHYRWGGYYRSLLTTSHSYFTGDAYGDSLNRLRLSFDASWKHAVLVHIDYDNLVHAGNLIDQPDFELVRDRQSGEYFDLLHVWLNEKHVYWDTSLYRSYITFQCNRAELTVGRQRIAWGTAHFWSPTDVFSPISPLQIETDERQGVDAAQLRLRFPHDIRSSLVYAPQDTLNASTEAARIATTIGNFDVAAIAGRFKQDWMAGGDFAGQWGGAGLQGELTYTLRANAKQPDALRLAIGSDYAFGKKWYLQGQYFYNQAQPPGYVPGKPFNPLVLLRSTNEIYTIQRHFISLGARYSITPLLKIRTYAVVDPAGGSVFFMPAGSYSLTANSELRVGGQLFASSPSGEFDGVPDLFYTEYTIHF